MPLIVLGASALFLVPATWLFLKSIPAADRESRPPLPPTPLFFPVDVDVVPPPTDASWLKVDTRWSLESVLADYRPHEFWRAEFTGAYGKAIESPRIEDRAAGWKLATIIFGDSHVPLFCLFVSLHGRSLLPQDSLRFDGNIDLCLLELRLAEAVTPGPSFPIKDLGKRAAFRRDESAAVAWLGEQLRPFGGSLEQAAIFAMRWTAVQFGLLRGPSDPSIAEVLDETLWTRVPSAPVN